MNPYNHALVQKILDAKPSTEVKELLIAYSNAHNSCSQVEFELSLANVRIKELEIFIQDLASHIAKQAKVKLEAQIDDEAYLNALIKAKS